MQMEYIQCGRQNTKDDTPKIPVPWLFSQSLI